MATTLAQKLALATDTTFIGQCKMQIIAEAINQLSSPRAASSLIKNEKMFRLAQSIVTSPDSYATQFAVVIAGNSALTSPVSDAAVATGVTQAFPIIAGVTAND